MNTLGWYRITGPHVTPDGAPYWVMPGGDDEGDPADMPQHDIYDTLYFIVQNIMADTRDLTRDQRPISTQEYIDRWEALILRHKREIEHLFSPASSGIPQSQRGEGRADRGVTRG